MKSITVISKETGEKLTAVYAPNRKGNMKYAVHGRFYSDRLFDEKFTIYVWEKEESPICDILAQAFKDLHNLIEEDLTHCAHIQLNYIQIICGNYPNQLDKVTNELLREMYSKADDMYNETFYIR